MLVRGILAAAVGTVLHHNPFDMKGKASATMISARRNYGSAGRLERHSSWSGSGSRSGERLDSVPEHVTDSLSDDDGEPSAWNNAEEESNESSNGDEDCWDNARDIYRRALRLYGIVPLGSTLLLLFTVFLPRWIASKPLPSPPSASRLVLDIVLSASLWCLAHLIRVPLYSILNAILSGLATFISFVFNSRSRRRTDPIPAASAYVAALSSLIHVVLAVFLQESLRVASFAILDLHWRQSNGPQPPLPHPRVRDAAFREVWALALGWALAEVCAGIIQGYEQLALYADNGVSRRTSGSSSKSGDEVMVGAGANNRVFDEEAVDLVRWTRSMPCVGIADDDIVEGAKALTRVQIDSAFIQLANVRARDELEELYGQPYIEIPVFVSLLQRLDSILLSLGNTLLLAAAYLPKPPYTPTSSSTSVYASSSLSQSAASHTHMLPLVPTFLIVAFIHSVLGVLHAPPVLARVGIPAAAYTSCIVGLGLTFAGVGVWVGLW